MQSRLMFICLAAVLWSGVSLLTGCAGDDKEQQAAPEDSVLSSGPVLLLSDSIRQHPDNPYYYFERGGVLFALSHYEKARRDLEKAVSLNPREAAYHFALGEINAADGQWQEALKNYRRALQLSPRSPQVRLRLAYVLFSHGVYAPASRQLDTVLQQHPDAAEAYGLRAQIFAETGDTAHALQEMRKAVKLEPGNYDALMAMGDLLSGGGKKEALAWYDKAYHSDTTRAEALFNKGLFYEKSGSTTRAIAVYRRCIVTDRSYIPAYLQLGGIYEKQGDWEKAHEVFNLATKADPANAEARAALDRLRRNIK